MMDRSQQQYKLLTSIEANGLVEVKSLIEPTWGWLLAVDDFCHKPLSTVEPLFSSWVMPTPRQWVT